MVETFIFRRLAKRIERIHTVLDPLDGITRQTVDGGGYNIERLVSDKV